jgi:hypothetical protein
VTVAAPFSSAVAAAAAVFDRSICCALPEHKSEVKLGGEVVEKGEKNRK